LAIDKFGLKDDHGALALVEGLSFAIDDLVAVFPGEAKLVLTIILEGLAVFVGLFLVGFFLTGVLFLSVLGLVRQGVTA
jgi:hypothetical protein